MEPYSLVGLFILVCLEGLFDPCTCLLDNAGGADIEAVRCRLQDEKEKRLLLENDVEIMMLKLAELEHRCRKNITAAMYCRVFGGSLVSIETPEELTVLRDFLQSSNASSMVWIDGTDMLNEGVWHWTTSGGSQEMIGKAGVGLWAGQQPDYFDYLDQYDHCLTLWKLSGRYDVKDHICSHNLPFLCEEK